MSKAKLNKDGYGRINLYFNPKKNSKEKIIWSNLEKEEYANETIKNILYEYFSKKEGQ